MARKYFGTDGIRGLANGSKLTPDLALRVGMATGLVFKRGDHRHRVVIGKDTRRSGYMIENALTAGFTAVGMDVFLLGPMPTPAVAMLTRSMRADLGVMISASHNLYEDNGIKLFRPDGYKLTDRMEEEIEKLMDSDLNSRLSQGQKIGRAKRIEEARTRYVEYAKRTLPRDTDFTGLRIVVDCANGAGYKVAPEALWELGAEVFAIGDKPDGFNINEKCGSTSPEKLSEKVRETRADIGIALDGDADRVLVVDERGEMVDGDQLMGVIAKSWHERGILSGGGIAATVMSNLGLERFLQGMDLKMDRAKVGDRYVLESMRANNFNLGGEQSGHIILSDFTTTGDGLVAALQLLQVVTSKGQAVSRVCDIYEKVPQLMHNVRFRRGQPLSDKNVMRLIEQGKNRLGEKGHLVIRASGTEPLIRIMGQGDDEALVAKVVREISDAIASAA